jgi:hypothetical protein
MNVIKTSPAPQILINSKISPELVYKLSCRYPSDFSHEVEEDSFFWLGVLEPTSRSLLPLLPAKMEGGPFALGPSSW